MLSCPSPGSSNLPPPLPNPWADQKPKSTEQPHLVVRLCSFTDRKLECHNGGSYPFHRENGTHKVPFYEFLGYGLPPSDVGNPGDIYIDQTPPCMVYVRTMDAWVRWDISVKRKVKLVDLHTMHMPQHPILSNRYLWKPWGGSTSNRLSWLTKQTIRNSPDYLFDRIAKLVEEMYQERRKPSKEEEERKEAEKNRRLLTAQNTQTSPSSKRGRPSSPVGNRSSPLNSFDGINDPDMRPGKKAKLTPNTTGGAAEEGFNPGKDIPNSVRPGGANLSCLDSCNLKDISKLSLNYGPDSEVDENDVVMANDTKGDAEDPGDEDDESDKGNESGEDNESDEDDESDESGADDECDEDEDDKGDKDDESNEDDEGEQHRDEVTIHISELNTRAHLTDPHPEDEDPIEAADSPDALTTRAFALVASVKDLDDARLAAEKKTKTMRMQLDDLMKNVENYEAKTLTLEAELKRLRTDNRKLESERKASESAEEKIRTFLEELETYKLRCTYAENLIATHEEQRREMAAKEKENEQKFLELSRQCAEAEAARVASDKALVDVKQMLRKIAV